MAILIWFLSWFMRLPSMRCPFCQEWAYKDYNEEYEFGYDDFYCFTCETIINRNDDRQGMK